MCARIEDEPRFRGLIAGWIAEGSVPSYPLFMGETEKKQKKRKRKYDKEAQEAEEMRREMGLKDDGMYRTNTYILKNSLNMWTSTKCCSPYQVGLLLLRWNVHYIPPTISDLVVSFFITADDDGLKSIIKARQQDREKQIGSFFDDLEQKYAKKPKKRKTIFNDKETHSVSNSKKGTRKKGKK